MPDVALLSTFGQPSQRTAVEDLRKLFNGYVGLGFYRGPAKWGLAFELGTIAKFQSLQTRRSLELVWALCIEGVLRWNMAA